MRGLLAEYGIVIAKGHAPLRHALSVVLENREGKLSGLMLELIADIAERLKFLDQWLKSYDLRIRQLMRSD